MDARPDAILRACSTAQVAAVVAAAGSWTGQVDGTAASVERPERSGDGGRQREFAGGCRER